MKTSEYYQLKRKYTDQLKDFESYLQKQYYSENTKLQYLNYTAYFLEWMNWQQLTENQIHYSDLLSYISYCREANKSTRLINRKLSAIRKYYEYLQFTGATIKNPASGFYLKSKRKNIPHNLLDKESLQQLYENYHAYDLRTARNKIIISLLIYQAVATDDLHKLEPTHVKLKLGKIEIPGGKHKNGRVLKLESHQIIELQEYLQIIRPEILKGIKENHVRQARKPNKINHERINNQLFISINGSVEIKNSLFHLTRALRMINPQIIDAKQIRQSVIAEWLKTEDVRKVQYKAGHRYVSTTERYQATNLEDLEEALKQHHPLK